MGGWVYIMTNRRDGTLYVGVASDLPRRAYQHREGLVDGFTKRYGLKVLVYYKQHVARIETASFSIPAGEIPDIAAPAFHPGYVL